MHYFYLRSVRPDGLEHASIVNAVIMLCMYVYTCVC